MRNDIYQKLIEHVTRRQWVDATEVFRAVLEQKIALRLESEKQLLQEPDDEDDEKTVSAEDCDEPGCPADEKKLKEDDEKEPEKRKCKACGKSFTPHNGEYARCKDCFDKQTDAGERASYGRY